MALFTDSVLASTAMGSNVGDGLGDIFMVFHSDSLFIYSCTIL